MLVILSCFTLPGIFLFIMKMVHIGGNIYFDQTYRNEKDTKQQNKITMKLIGGKADKHVRSWAF